MSNKDYFVDSAQQSSSVAEEEENEEEEEEEEDDIQPASPESGTSGESGSQEPLRVTRSQATPVKKSGRTSNTFSQRSELHHRSTNWYDYQEKLIYL